MRLTVSVCIGRAPALAKGVCRIAQSKAPKTASAMRTPLHWMPGGFSSSRRVSKIVKTDYVWPLQCVGVLLTAALVGALVLVMEEKRE